MNVSSFTYFLKHLMIEVVFHKIKRWARDDDIILWMQANMSKLKQLSSLDLSYTDITEIGLEWIYNMVKTCNLQQLKISHVPISSQGFFFIEKIIRSQALQVLYLEETNMTPSDYCSLLDAIVQQSSLISVSFANNPIGTRKHIPSIGHNRAVRSKSIHQSLTSIALPPDLESTIKDYLPILAVA